MSVITFRPAVRGATSVFIGLTGPSGSGKTFSALRLATGLAGGRPIAFIDTESGKALHYADRFTFQHGRLAAPFHPERYVEALAATAPLKPGVIIVDSTSHSHDGPGGVLEMHDAELDRRAGDDWQKREKLNFGCWAKPKAAYTRLVNTVLQLNINVIFCFRAKEKLRLVDVIKDGKKKTEPVPQGWQPIMTGGFEFEMTALLVLPPKSKGVPDLNAEATKMIDELAPIFSAGRPINEQMGRELAAWCEGASGPGGVRMKLIAAGESAAAKGPDYLQAWWANLDRVARETVGIAERNRLAEVAKTVAAGSPAVAVNSATPSTAPANPSTAQAKSSTDKAKSSTGTPGELPLGGAEAAAAPDAEPSEWELWAADAASHLNACRSVGQIRDWEADHRSYFDQLRAANPAVADHLRATIDEATRRLTAQKRGER